VGREPAKRRRVADASANAPARRAGPGNAYPNPGSPQPDLAPFTIIDAVPLADRVGHAKPTTPVPNPRAPHGDYHPNPASADGNPGPNCFSDANAWLCLCRVGS